jgi:hypothetical protein
VRRAGPVATATLSLLLWTGIALADQVPAPAPAAAAAPASASDSPPPPPPQRYFYFGYDYGTQALYSPLWVFVNRGYDVLQDHVASRNVFDIQYRSNGENVLRNLAHPFSNVSDLGWKTFLTQEIFPLSFTPSTARWVPNYGLHLIGGGMTYRGMTEWFEDHHVPLARVLSAVTLMAAALLNETLENKGIVGRNTDAIADVWVFDIGGILLFSFDAPSWFFSQQLIVSDWSLQPALTFPHGELHNVGNYFAAKWPLPFYRRLRLFGYVGEATTGGLSFALDDQYSVSVAAGAAATHLVNNNPNAVENTVNFSPTALIFLDRRDSLLASLQVTNAYDYFVHLNVYPHALTPRGPSVGFWTVVDQRAHVALGISISRLLGMGTGYSGI